MTSRFTDLEGSTCRSEKPLVAQGAARGFDELVACLLTVLDVRAGEVAGG